MITCAHRKEGHKQKQLDKTATQQQSSHISPSITVLQVHCQMMMSLYQSLNLIRLGKSSGDCHAILQ